MLVTQLTLFNIISLINEVPSGTRPPGEQGTKQENHRIPEGTESAQGKHREQGSVQSRFRCNHAAGHTGRAVRAHLVLHAGFVTLHL